MARAVFHRAAVGRPARLLTYHPAGANGSRTRQPTEIAPPQPAVDGPGIGVGDAAFRPFGSAPAAALLIALAWLDGRHRWLPDRLTQPLLWGGLLCNLDARWAPLDDAVIGAAAGYGALWLLNALYRQVRRRNGIGQGDFKLLAALGAWLGWTTLPLLVCLAAAFGLGLAAARGRHPRRGWRTPQPFGIALAAAGWLQLLMGADQSALTLFG